MTIDTKPQVDQPPLPNKELWRALLTLFNYYFNEELGRFRMCPDRATVPDEVVEAVRLLDCWLDLAAEEGWV